MKFAFETKDEVVEHYKRKAAECLAEHKRRRNPAMKERYLALSDTYASVANHIDRIIILAEPECSGLLGAHELIQAGRNMARRAGVDRSVIEVLDALLLDLDASIEEASATANEKKPQDESPRLLPYKPEVPAPIEIPESMAHDQPSTHEPADDVPAEIMPNANNAPDWNEGQ